MQARLMQYDGHKRGMAAMNNAPTIFDYDAAEQGYELQDAAIHRGFGPVGAIGDRS
jgi:hypothetical protein